MQLYTTVDGILVNIVFASDRHLCEIFSYYLVYLIHSSIE